MIHNNFRRFEIGIKLSDLLVIVISWWIAYFFRFGRLSINPGSITILEWYAKLLVLLVFLSYYFFRKSKVYNTTRLPAFYESVLSVITANLTSFFIFILAVFFMSEQRVSRIFILNYLVLSSVLLIMNRVCIRKIMRLLNGSISKLRPCLLIGNTPQIQAYAKKIQEQPEYGLSVSKWLKTDEEIEAYDFEKENEIKVLIIGLENEKQKYISIFLKEFSTLLIDIVILPDMSNAFVGYKVVEISGYPAILLNEPDIKNRSIILKRLMDIVCSIIGLIILSPLFAIIAIAIKFSSKGPILYSQVRMGLDGKEFKMYKFRSMRADGTNKETWTKENDPRVTKVGKFLRKTSLDEFPQLFNVLIGNMSLVGPRPERPMYVEEFKKDISAYMLRHKMKAGITGWAQVNGWRGDTSIEKRIECDLYYIRHWSLGLDVWIIFKTFWKGFIHKNAY